MRTSWIEACVRLLVACVVLVSLGCGGTAAGPDGTVAAKAATSSPPIARKQCEKPVSANAAPAKEDVVPDGEDKDYWANIDFDRFHFDQVRRFVRMRYIDTKVDDARAYASAAEFALASDRGRSLLLLPTRFYYDRCDHADEKGRLTGKMHQLSATDKFVIVEAVKTPSDAKRLTDDEIRVLRRKARARRVSLEKAWKEVAFGKTNFERVMEWALANLGTHSKWTGKAAWVAAAQGYLYSLDPHSSLIPKQAWDDSTRSDPSFEGIGAVLTRRPASDYTIVETPIDGHPAIAAGLRAGDVITKVDGKSTKNALLPAVVKRIRGKAGTKVVLTVRRLGHPNEIDIGIVRAKVVIRNVSGQMLPDYDGIGYVKVTGFLRSTDHEMVRLIESLKKQRADRKLRGLILDLRNNGGGRLGQAITIADRFLARGKIVTVKSRRQTADEVHQARPSQYEMPLVVLVNDGSASASEIVASALQENGRALIVGDRTFGKASVQTLFTPAMGSGYFIKLTVARYYSPSGRGLQAVGVRPDIEVPPDIGGKMPLGFREEDLSNHLLPDDGYPKTNSRYAGKIKQCAQTEGQAKALHARDPNPTLKFDHQRIAAADMIDCMNKHPR